MTRANPSNGGEGFSAAKMFDELELGPPRILTVAIKRANSAKNICFSRASDCNSWEEISEDIVLRYEYVGEMKCGDHSHSIVRLFLKPPTTPAERAFLMAESAVATATPVFSDIQAFSDAAFTPFPPLGGYYPSKGNCVRNQFGQLVDRVTGMPCI